MKATVLIDNISKNNLKKQWGLCFYIEHENKKILLDTGSSDTFFKNAEMLNINLSSVDFAVLSHAHYDHSNGFGAFFSENKNAKLYLSNKCEENCYGKRWIFSKYIGIKKGLMEKHKDRLTTVNGFYKIDDDIFLAPHNTENLCELGKKSGIYIKKGRKLIPDDFCHEQSLIIKTEKGLVIFNSCSHGGADNIIKETAELFPNENIYALIGGFHLYRSDEKDVYELAKRIKETGIEKIYTGHCTGDKAFKILKDELGENATQLYSGLVIEI